MKVVHVVPALTKGGAERVAVDLANRAAAAGHEAALVAGERVDERLLRHAIAPEVELHYVAGGGGKAGRYLAMLAWLWRRRAWLLDRDAVHVHLTYGALFGTLLQAMRRLYGGRRPAVVETYHAVGMRIPRLDRWFHAKLLAGRDAVAFMAEDPYWRRFRDRRPRLAAAIVPNGIAFAPPRARGSGESAAYAREIGLPPGTGPVVGTVGRLVPARRPDLYVPVFAEIARAMGPEARFVVAGYGPERPGLEQRFHELELDRQVLFAGRALDPTLPMSLMDLYLTVNVGPITGVAALEAAAAGLPIVAVQLLDGYEARPEDWIWSSGDLAAVATRAIELLRDETARRKLAERQKAYVEAHHSVEVMARGYDRLYERALASLDRP
jgi:glycosyltransferase involved in cell wall biosynthesis